MKIGALGGGGGGAPERLKCENAGLWSGLELANAKCGAPELSRLKREMGRISGADLYL